jgi:hypothetical protein
MKRIAFLLIAMAGVTCVLCAIAPAAGPADEGAAPIFGIKFFLDTATGSSSP